MKELRVEAKIDNLAAVQDFVGGFLEEMGCDMKTQLSIDIAVEEIFVNVASYAYGSGTGEATVRVTTETEPGSAEITVIDGGKAYNPLEKPDPDIGMGVEDREHGGFGVFMVKNAMDEVAYLREDGKNILRLRKTW